MNKLHSLLSEAEKSFDKEFLCQIPEHLAMSDHVFAHDKVGKLPQEFKLFLRTTLKQALQAILEAAPEEKEVHVNLFINEDWERGFNLAREQSLSIIKEYLKEGKE